MKNLTLLSFFFFALALPIHPQSLASSSPNSTEFIRKSCASTLYPKLCFTSLSPYASTINQNPLKLSVFAIHLSFNHVKSVKAKVSSFLTSSTQSVSKGSAVTKPLKDCAQMLSDAADQARKSMLEVKKMKPVNGGGGGTDYNRLCLSNVQTWMSAALTNEDTCVGGLVEGGGYKSGVARYVGDKVGAAEEYTSVALALVNLLAHV